MTKHLEQLIKDNKWQDISEAPHDERILMVAKTYGRLLSQEEADVLSRVERRASELTSCVEITLRYAKKCTKLEEDAYTMRRLIWELAQAVGVKNNEPYDQEAVIHRAISLIKGTRYDHIQ